MLVDGRPISATIFDIVVYAFSNSRILIEKYKQSCYFYLPKIQYMEEAIFYDDLLTNLEHYLKVPENSFKVTLIVESISAIFELEEIMFVLQQRLIGLCTGKWNYIFSIIKRFKSHPDPILPPRNKIENDEPFLIALDKFIVHTAHKRGMHAINGASNYLPKVSSMKETDTAKLKVAFEKFTESFEGYDGSWVVHPQYVDTARQCYDMALKSSYNQLVKFSGLESAIHPSELLCFVDRYNNTEVNKEDVLSSIRVCLIYYYNWLRGIGAVGNENLMEDAATMEICRT